MLPFKMFICISCFRNLQHVIHQTFYAMMLKDTKNVSHPNSGVMATSIVKIRRTKNTVCMRAPKKLVLDFNSSAKTTETALTKQMSAMVRSTALMEAMK